jgi:YVTN family beta-propeller protein
MRPSRTIFAAALLSLITAGTATAQTYHVATEWKVGGQGGWDYLRSDDATHRLYLTHNARVEVLDTTTGKPIGAVTGLKSTHGVAFNTDGKTGYISDGAGNAIVVFDRASLAIIATVPAGTNPDSIAFEPLTKTAWAFNGRSTSVSVLDSATNTVVATIPLPGKPEFAQVDGKGLVYDAIEDKNQIVKLDARARKVVDVWPTTGCKSPSGTAIDTAGHRLFAVCDEGKMIVLDTNTGKVLGLASIGKSPDAAAFDPKNNLAFSSNGEGTLSVIDASKPDFPTVQTLKTARGARTMALDATTGRIFLVTAEFGPAPEPTPTAPRPRPAVIPDSFKVLVIER